MDLVTSTIFEPTVHLDIDIKSLPNRDFDKLHIIGWSEEGVAFDFIKHMILRDNEERDIMQNLYDQGRLIIIVTLFIQGTTTAVSINPGQSLISF